MCDTVNMSNITCVHLPLFRLRTLYILKKCVQKTNQVAHKLFHANTKGSLQVSLCTILIHMQSRAPSPQYRACFTLYSFNNLSFEKGISKIFGKIN